MFFRFELISVVAYKDLQDALFVWHPLIAAKVLVSRTKDVQHQSGTCIFRTTISSAVTVLLGLRDRHRGRPGKGYTRFLTAVSGEAFYLLYFGVLFVSSVLANAT